MSGFCESYGRRADEAGFTLVEMIVALALFSLLSVLLFNNVKFGVQAWRGGSARADELQRSVVTQELLRRLLGNAYPLVVMQDALQPRIDFEGTREAVEFLSDAPVVSGGAGRYRFKLFADRTRQQTDLVMTAAPELASAQDSSASRTLLVSDIDHAELAYFGTPSPGALGRWNDSWERQSDVPNLVRLRVWFRASDPRTWPELVVTLRVRVDVSCVYDPITMRCRGR
ncbi:MULTISPECIES: prepilin-type N-terminal cleavage/methylation domain-containing protein [unclassified Bradyrhizobium]|uniref:prepilin-type N-terminal cleavage/methylation domain-containing protein n=1 Tax=unclassified Bradyrhizobium TaxID=2631580 RepID=UPI0028E23613|nr:MULTISPECIES: prepilin-type N-terminal cleavage/methylation domain-containing protein [unclassified Bradyrhizobium]